MGQEYASDYYQDLASAVWPADAVPTLLLPCRSEERTYVVRSPSCDAARPHRRWDDYPKKAAKSVVTLGPAC